MQSTLDWQDLNLFLAVARAGGLTPAGPATGLSAATLSRRMAAIERTLGCRLFERGPQGYALTGAGVELRDRAAAVEQAMLGIERWRAGGASGRVVRISAGAWVSHRLAGRIGELRPPGMDWLLELVTDDARRDIARREVDIGIRNRRPEEPWLAGRRLGQVAFAAYGRDGDPAVPGDTPAAALVDRPWIGRTEREASTPSAAWIDRHHTARVVLRSNAPRILLDLVQAGAGVTVLPTFVGDDAPGLVRLGAPIDELVHDQWLVAHHEGRHDPPVRAVIDRLVAVLGAG